MLTKTEAGIDRQLTEIRKVSNHAILAIWVAGINSTLIFIVYYIFFSANAAAIDKSRFNAMNGLNSLSDKALFADKTTLVNMGLKIQEMSDFADVKSHGSISIRKIKYDQQLKQNKVKHTAKPGFFVGSIPK